MMKHRFVLFTCIYSLVLLSCSTKAQRSVISEGVSVFTSGTGGYKSFRIPAIIKAPDGCLLAFAEGRVDGGADFGHVKIVVRRSVDEGKTWGAVQVAASNGTLQAGNPAPVVDYTDPAFPKGRIFLFYNTGNVDEGRMRKKEGVRQIWYVTSVDNGNNWTTPVNITDQVSRIDQPQLKPGWNHKQDWRSYANTPGHALQLEKGKFAGRIYVAANHSQGSPKKDFTDYVAHGFYTDDHGKTFQLSENNPFKGSNESTAAELSGGRVMMNSRDQSGQRRDRIVAISSDGGRHWDTAYHDKNLPDPVCEGAILTLEHGSNGNVLAFCNAASRTGRDSLTLRISNDDGKTWSKKFLLEPANIAYSDIVNINKHQVGVLYEAGGYQKIIFKKVNWKKHQ